ncbi:hypothetical protein COLO4_05346 [Corchorus olitorius]|uniref:Uncharacterized protein n=1 Tax=Corchorus olitorius TaxID=93759 RepID=A0A1R3KR40_9ROSI|nr:hypothetical protein COLO4_05346 [Corchorus olitorius]
MTETLWTRDSKETKKGDLANSIQESIDVHVWEVRLHDKAQGNGELAKAIPSLDEWL